MDSIYATGCNCKEFCVEFVDRMETCVDYIARNAEVMTKHCESCGSGHTWHRDGVCMKCEERPDAD
jgi:hypothetical protein